jgi:hypothetical protein
VPQSPQSDEVGVSLIVEGLEKLEVSACSCA